MAEREKAPTSEQEFCHLCQDLEMCQFASVLARAASEGTSIRIRFHQPEFRVCIDYEQLKNDYLNPTLPEISEPSNYYERLFGHQAQPVDTPPPSRNTQASPLINTVEQPESPTEATDDTNADMELEPYLTELELNSKVDITSEPQEPTPEVPLPPSLVPPINETPAPSAAKKKESWSINPSGKKPKKTEVKKSVTNNVNRVEAAVAEIEAYLNRCKTPPELHEQFKAWASRLSHRTYLFDLMDIRDELQALEYSTRGTPKANESESLGILFFLLLQYVAETKNIPLKTIVSQLSML